jgi:hypothetical protein
MTNEEAVVLALKETLRYGFFLGTFAGTYVSVDECIAALWGRKRSVQFSHSHTPRTSNSSTSSSSSYQLAKEHSVTVRACAEPYYCESIPLATNLSKYVALALLVACKHRHTVGDQKSKDTREQFSFCC